MPSRSFIWAIIVFWLATAGWLFYTEFVPRFRPNQPPRFYHFDFADEVRNNPNKWFVYQDRKAIGEPINESKDKIGTGDTKQERNKHNFTLATEFLFSKLHIPAPQVKAKVTKITDRVRVSLEEELQEIDTTLAVEIELAKNRIPISGSVSLKGKVEDGVFTPEVKVEGFQEYAWLFRKLLSAGPVPMPRGQSFMNPMHPLSRIPGLWEGQHWHMPQVDLLGSTFKSSLDLLPFVEKQAPSLYADVTAQVLHRKEGDFPCLVIDYRRKPGEDVEVRTWVRKSDSLVLRQEATLQGLTLQGMRLVLDRGVLPK